MKARIRAPKPAATPKLPCPICHHGRLPLPRIGEFRLGMIDDEIGPIWFATQPCWFCGGSGEIPSDLVRPEFDAKAALEDARKKRLAELEAG